MTKEDFERLAEEADRFASQELDCRVQLKVLEDGQYGLDATFVMLDEEDEEVGSIIVWDSGTHQDRQMMGCNDGRGPTIMEATGQNVVRMLYV